MEPTSVVNGDAVRWSPTTVRQGCKAQVPTAPRDGVSDVPHPCQITPQRPSDLLPPVRHLPLIKTRKSQAGL